MWVVQEFHNTPYGRHLDSPLPFSSPTITDLGLTIYAHFRQNNDLVYKQR